MRFSAEEKKLIDYAIKLKNMERYGEAMSILKELEPQHINSGILMGLIGTIHFLSEDFSKSQLYFQKTAKINPKSETASLGLFHSLWNLGFWKAALEEAFRYLSQEEISLFDYKVLLQELYVSTQESEDKWEQDEVDKISLLYNNHFYN